MGPFAVLASDTCVVGWEGVPGIAPLLACPRRLLYLRLRSYPWESRFQARQPEVSIAAYQQATAEFRQPTAAVLAVGEKLRLAVYCNSQCYADVT